jgi:hypothetical protein
MGWNASDQIGRYEVRGQLGAGGFATVLLAYDPVLDGSVAIKVLADNLSLDPDVRARFIQEARVLRGLRSERLVTVYDIGELPSGQPYLVMELARRGTLGSRLDQARARGLAPRLDDVSRVVDDLAAALRVVHAAGVVHRDLKPSNLLLQGEGDGPDEPTDLMLADESLMLGDFGMAKVLGADSLQLTMQGGTLGYMAPEQLRPFHPIDQRADLYAATTLVVELLSGRVPPRPEPGHTDGLDEILTGMACDAQLASALRHGLAFDPERRFPSIDAWHDALRTSLEQAATTALAAVSPPVPVDSGWADHATTFLPVTQVGGPVTDQPPGPTARRTGRTRLALTVAAAIGLVAVLLTRFDSPPDAAIVGPDKLTVGDVGAFVTDAEPGDEVEWDGPGDAPTSDAVLQVRPTSPGSLRISAEVRPADGPTRVGHITVEVVADEDDATEIAGPALLIVGRTGTLTATVPSGTTPLWIDWDGREHTGDRLTLQPKSAGVLHVELRATDGDGETHRARHTVTVVDE